jgi:hypothetical protein
MLRHVSYTWDMTTTAETPERRKALRFRVALPVELKDRTGVTCNVSVSGVLFETDQSFSLGEPIRLTLMLEYADPAQPIRLQCRGQVVRIERRDGQVGVAVAITAFRFEPPQDPGLWQGGEEVTRFEHIVVPPDPAGVVRAQAVRLRHPETPRGC